MLGLGAKCLTWVFEFCVCLLVLFCLFRCFFLLFDIFLFLVFALGFGFGCGLCVLFLACAFLSFLFAWVIAICVLYLVILGFCLICIGLFVGLMCRAGLLVW